MRFLQPIDNETEKWLKIIENSSEESSMTRNRALAIRLSFNKFQVKQIATICNITMETVYTWFNNWEKHGFDSLLVLPGQGRKKLIEPSEYDEVLKIVDENPKQLKSALAEIKKRMGKIISIYTLKRIICKKSWRRVRKSLKEKRNEVQFQKVKEEINLLQQDEKKGAYRFILFDESGFSLGIIS